MKQFLVSIVAILVAAGVFVGMVLYSLSVIHAAQMKILTGEISVSCTK